MPGALWGLALALGPVLIHLLRRRRAHRVVVPTIRFVSAVSQSSVRMRPPDDLLLLAVRTLIIAASVLAVAAPIVMTDARREAWDRRVARAVIVDTSGSVNAVERDRRAADELTSAFMAVRVESESIREALRRSAAWLTNAPPARDEIVVISDFQRGSMSAIDLADVSESTGVRFVRVASVASAAAADDGMEVVEGRAYRRRVETEGEATSLSLAADSGRALPLRIEGAPPEVTERLQRIVRQAGVASAGGGPTIVRFGAPSSGTATTTSASAGAATRLAANPRLAGTRFDVSAEGDSLIVTTDVDPASLEAAALVQAALEAWQSPSRLDEQEPRVLPDEMLQSWTRPAQPVDVSAWRRSERTDARWLWLLALVLLAVEWRLRRSVNAVRESHVRAA